MCRSQRFRDLTGCLLICGSLLFVAPPSSRAMEPGEVTGLGWGEDRGTLEWNPEPLADSYNVYRGYIQDLAPDFFGTTLEAEVASATFQDPVVPARGWVTDSSLTSKADSTASGKRAESGERKMSIE